LKLYYEEPASNFAFKFKLRRYIKAAEDAVAAAEAANAAVKAAEGIEAGAYTRPLFSST